MRYQRLLAIDPSLTCSGWALFDIRTGKLKAVGKIRSMSARHPLAQRLDDLHNKAQRLIEILELDFNDVLIAEDVTTMKDPDAAIKVEQVRGIFENAARANGLCVPGRLNPRTVHAEILGVRGRQPGRPLVKAMAVAAVQKIFSDSLERLAFDTSSSALNANQDIVDAILIGHLASSKVRIAQEGDFDVTLCFQKGHSSRARAFKGALLN